MLELHKYVYIKIPIPLQLGTTAAFQVQVHKGGKGFFSSQATINNWLVQETSNLAEELF